MQKRFFRLAIPNILSNFTVPLVGLADTAMLGHLPDIRFLAGVALAGIVFDYLYWSFGFLRMSTTGLTAQAVGREESDEVYAILYRSLLIAAMIGIIILLLQNPISELSFALLAGEPGTIAAGMDYFAARIIAAPATLCNYALLGWFLGREQSRIALVMTACANFVNIILNYVFLFEFGWQAWGVGLATAISQYLMSAIALIYFLRQRDRVPPTRPAIFNRQQLRAILVLNRDILIRTICLISAFALFTNFSAALGTAILAANSIILRLLAMAAYLIDGLAFAVESLAGIYRGQKDNPALRRLLKLSLIWAEGLAGIFGLILLLIPDLLFGLLTSHVDIIALLHRYIGWTIVALVFSSLAYIFDGFFLGMAEGQRLRSSMLLSTLVFFVPPALAGLYLQNNDLLWGAMVSFMAARAGTLWLQTGKMGIYEGTGTADGRRLHP